MVQYPYILNSKTLLHDCICHGIQTVVNILLYIKHTKTKYKYNILEYMNLKHMYILHVQIHNLERECSMLMVYLHILRTPFFSPMPNTINFSSEFPVHEVRFHYFHQINPQRHLTDTSIICSQSNGMRTNIYACLQKPDYNRKYLTHI